MRSSDRLTRSLFTVVAIGLIGVGAAGCGGGEVPEAEPLARPVSTIVIGEGLAGRLTFPGTVQAADRAELSFRVPGPLMELPVNEGQAVSQGQLMARIDPRDYQIALAEARATFEQSKSDAVRYQRLYEREAIPLADLEVRLARRDVAEARFEQAEADLQDTRLRAPFTGLIGRRYVENFEDIRAKQVILSLHAVDQVEVVVNVPESIMASVRAGSEPKIVVVFEPAPDRAYTAIIKEFAARADPQTQTFAVTVSLPQPEDINILPGMTATVGVTADLSGEAGGEEPVTIPAHAVFSDPEGGANVWVVDESLTVHRRPVSAGPVTGSDGIIILDGLAPGERIVTAGVQSLREGQEVRLMGSQR